MKEDWAWGLSLVALTIVIHATGIAVIAIVLKNVLNQIQYESLWAGGM